MTTVQGYFKNKAFVTDSNIFIPDGQPVLVTILENKPTNEAAEAQRLRKIYTEYFDAIQAVEGEELTEEFDKVLAEGITFRDVDFS
ncbi:hypothetical protein AGMMS49546_35030 [Spirochaetia bacterium]|nr:hypothetical protein AGMMS49546_35030 [Spirochaetia bacterium]